MHLLILELLLACFQKQSSVHFKRTIPKQENERSQTTNASKLLDVQGDNELNSNTGSHSQK
jgi:hypothetical protein